MVLDFQPKNRNNPSHAGPPKSSNSDWHHQLKTLMLNAYCQCWRVETKNFPKHISRSHLMPTQINSLMDTFVQYSKMFSYSYQFTTQKLLYKINKLKKNKKKAKIPL